MKFSIRDLLLVTVIVALVLGWGIDHRYLGLKISNLSWKVKAFDGATHFLGFDSSFDDSGIALEARGSQQNYTYSFRISKNGNTITALPNSQSPAPKLPKP